MDGATRPWTHIQNAPHTDSISQCNCLKLSHYHEQFVMTWRCRTSIQYTQ